MSLHSGYPYLGEKEGSYEKLKTSIAFYDAYLLHHMKRPKGN